MEEAYHNLVWAVLITVTYLNNTCNFLLYVVTAATFREQLVALFTRKRPSVMRTWGGSSRETGTTIQLDTCSVDRKWKSVCYHIVCVPPYRWRIREKAIVVGVPWFVSTFLRIRAISESINLYFLFHEQLQEHIKQKKNYFIVLLQKKCFPPNQGVGVEHIWKVVIFWYNHILSYLLYCDAS